jgi:WD40 repeat protein
MQQPQAHHSVWSLIVCNDRLVSGAADGTIRIWDLRERRALQVYSGYHNGSVWAIAADTNRGMILSSGKDGNVFATDMQTHRAQCIIQDKLPVVAMTASSTGHLWTSTSQPNVYCWVRAGS